MEVNRLAEQSKIYLLTRELPNNPQLEQLLAWFKHHPTDEEFLWENPDQTKQILTWGKFNNRLGQPTLTDFKQGENLIKQLLPQIIKLQQAEDRDLRIVGGMAFAKEPALPTNWGRLTNGAVWLPQVIFERTADRTKCSILGDTAVEVTKRWQQISTAIHAEKNLLAQAGTLKNFHVASVEQWQLVVQQAIQKIHDTALQKVVLGRFAQGVVSEDVPEAMWLCLREIQAGTYHILLRAADVTFLCASPERLLAVKPGRVLTAALAGTVARSQNPIEDQQLQEALRHDPKNRQEHAFVVNWIRQVLTGNGLRILNDDGPRIFKTPSVAHLYTPIEAIGNFSIADLLTKMHPTPALGGVPRQLALELLTLSESEQRGLFGSPIGLLDGAGYGDFAVGIRSCFIRRHRAHFFAGAGIVANSLPEKETAETSAKFNAILSIFKKELPKNGK